MPKSICDRCYEPGACCKRLSLYGAPNMGGDGRFTSWIDDTPAEVKANLKMYCEISGQPDYSELWVFESFSGQIYTDDKTGKQYAPVTLKCTALQANGRCGIYKTRPETCRVFEPLSDELCVHYKGSESGDPSIPLPITI